jgi:carbon monoxide dehydrogenase subunit G
MKVDGSYAFNAPRDFVWSTMLDPEVLARTLPGVQELELVGENQYKAQMKIKIGPVQGSFRGEVNLSDLREPEYCRIEVDGKGAPGFVKGEGELRLEANGDATTLIYNGDARVGGRLASVGQRLMESSTQALIGQSLESLDAQIEAALKGEDAAEAVPSPPTELQFAAGVTKRMVTDIVPPERAQNILVGVAVVGVALLFTRVLSNWWTNRLANEIADILEERKRVDQ